MDEKKENLTDTAKELVEKMPIPKRPPKKFFGIKNGSHVNNRSFENDFGQFVDCYGRKFDPELHINKKGRPLVSASGLLRCKKNKAMTVSQMCDVSNIIENKDETTAITDTNIEQEKAPAGPDVKLQDEALGSASAEIIFTLGIAIFGQDYLPTENERLYMSSAFTQYYKSKNMNDLPPGLILATAILSYIAPRLHKETSITKIKKCFYWVKSKIFRQPMETNHKKQAAG